MSAVWLAVAVVVTTPIDGFVAPPVRTLGGTKGHGVQPPKKTVAKLITSNEVFEGAQNFFDKLFEADPETLRQQPKWLSKVKGVAKYADQVAAIEALGPQMAALSDAELSAKTTEFRERYAAMPPAEKSLDALLVEAFAVCREASRRVLGLYHYDVQLCGGIALHEGKLAEMATGEGKTLVATLPLYLRALGDRDTSQSHLVTVNDYLARRDAETLGPLYEFLGLTVGVVQGSSTTEARRQAYACDVTYVTNNELGFDYLRDHLCYDAADLTVTKRPLSFAIVDEADSILVDESRTPLIISSQADNVADVAQKYAAAAEVAAFLAKGRDYEVDAKQRRVTLTEEGYRTACDLFGVTDLYSFDTKWIVYLQPSLNAKECYVRERDYIVDKKRSEVVIVDEFTGRVMEGRRWNGGLHQAMEAKERVEVKPEQVTSASITYQSLFKLYGTLAGMTGTAKTEAKELKDTFGTDFDVVSIPTAKPMRRDDRDDLVYATKLAKFRAVLRDVLAYHAEGRPVLVGTVTVEDSSLISELLDNEGVPHRVLNAKPEVAQRESEIVAQAGRLGAVTIATNMAGRGTDILLGGNAGLFAKIVARRHVAPLVDANLGPVVAGAAAEDIYPSKLSAATAARVEAAATSAAAALLEKPMAPSDFDAQTSSSGWSPLPTDDDDDEDLPTKLARVDDVVAQAVAAAARAEYDARTGQQTTEDRDVVVELGRAIKDVEDEFAVVVDRERDEVRALGGLVVLGTERHESRRIDLQLRGRAGRQGDAGESVFAISLEDKMFNVFGADKMKQLRLAFEFAGDVDEPLSSGMLTNSLMTIQEKVENYYRDIRGNLFKYDRIVDAQRRVFYGKRQQILRASRAELDALIATYCVDTARDVLANATYALTKSAKKNLVGAQGPLSGPDDVANVAVSQVGLMFPRAAEAVGASVADFVAEKWAQQSGGGPTSSSSSSSSSGAAAAAAATTTPPETDAIMAVNVGELEAALSDGVRRGVAAQLAAIDAKQDDDEDLAAAVVRFLVLREFDRGWKGHIQELELLREMIGFEAMAQKDPYNEWILKSNELFKQVSANIYRFAAIAFLSLDPDTALVKQPVVPSPRRKSELDKASGADGGVVDVAAGFPTMPDAAAPLPTMVPPPPQQPVTPATPLTPPPPTLAAQHAETAQPAAGNRAARRAQKKEAGGKSRRQRG